MKGCIKFHTLGISSIKPDCHDGYNYSNNHLCRIINYCAMYRTQHNDGREGDREVGKRWRGEREGYQEGLEVKRRKEEEREGTEGERKITFCGVRGKDGEREKWREREREREREGGS